MYDNIPKKLKYSKQHEWLHKKEKSIYTLGITYHAQNTLGEIVFVELPSLGDSFSAGDCFAVAESVKSASDIYIPISGKIISVNNKLKENPDLINSHPYEQGWIAKIYSEDQKSFLNLLDFDQYRILIESI